jgi:hypothetical protein
MKRKKIKKPALRGADIYTCIVLALMEKIYPIRCAHMHKDKVDNTCIAQYYTM